MKKFEITGYEEGKRAMFFDKLTHLDVRRYVGTGLEVMPYMVTINMQAPNFHFDGKDKFYVLYQDYERDELQNKEHQELVEGKSEDEAKEIIQGLYVEYVKPLEWYVEVKDIDIVKKVCELITKCGI